MALFKGKKAEQLAERAKELVDAGKVDEAFAQLKSEGQELGPDPWTKLASAMLDAEQPNIAERAIETALENDPDNWRALLMKADLVAKSCDQDAVAAAHKERCDADPQHQGAAVELAELLFQKEDFAGVVAALERFKDNAEQRTAFHLGRGFLLCERPEEAAELLGKAVDELQLGLQQASSHEERDKIKEELDEATRLHKEAVSAAHGREE